MSGRDLHPDLAAATAAKTVYPALLVKIGSAEGDVLVWSGYGPFTWGALTFQGVGHFGGVSNIEETAELKATGLSFSLSAVPPEMLSLAIGAARQGLPAVVWFVALDRSGAMVGEPYQLFSGRTDVPSIDEQPDSPTITISAESRLVDLDRPRVRRYTPQDQYLDAAGDLGFEFVAGLQEREVKFGRT